MTDLICDVGSTPGHPFPEQPEVGPAPLTALALRAMPTALHFRRSHFAVPAWQPETRIEVTGSVESPRVLTLGDVQRGTTRTVSAVLECAGHRRAELHPDASGVPWSLGAVSEAAWTGVPLREVLHEAGVLSGAVAVAFHGRDRGRRPETAIPVAFSRAIALAKALHPDTLLAWEMNGEAIPPVHGGPLRVIVPGHYAVDSVKWVDGITVLERHFDGPFQAVDYRLGEGTAGELHELPVHSLVLQPSPANRVERGANEVSGIAWGGSGGIARVEVAIDGADWRDATIAPTTPWGRTYWRLSWHADPGAHRIAARATDASGVTQPETPRWNPRGYANNSVHRIALHAR